MSVASRNPFDLLAEDEVQEAPLQIREVVKTSTSARKRVPKGDETRSKENAYKEPQGQSRDKGHKTDSNRQKSAKEQPGIGRGRGRAHGRGREFDRRSQTGRTDSEKQVSQGWGANRKEWDEEKAADSIAQDDRADATEADAAGQTNAEQQSNLKTLDEYLAEKTEKIAGLGSLSEARRPVDDGKWNNAVPIERDQKVESYFEGVQRDRSSKQKLRKEKQFVDMEMIHPPRHAQDRGDGGGRGARGGRGGRGGFHGGRGDSQTRGARSTSEKKPWTASAPLINIVSHQEFPTLGQ